MNRFRAMLATLAQIHPWLKRGRMLWLWPLLVLLLFVGLLLAFAAAHPAASPFVYLLF